MILYKYFNIYLFYKIYHIFYILKYYTVYYIWYLYIMWCLTLDSPELDRHSEVHHGTHGTDDDGSERRFRDEEEQRHEERQRQQHYNTCGQIQTFRRYTYYKCQQDHKSVSVTCDNPSSRRSHSGLRVNSRSVSKTPHKTFTKWRTNQQTL